MARAAGLEPAILRLVGGRSILTKLRPRYPDLKEINGTRSVRWSLHERGWPFAIPDTLCAPTTCFRPSSRLSYHGVSALFLIRHDRYASFNVFFLTL